MNDYKPELELELVKIEKENDRFDHLVEIIERYRQLNDKIEEALIRIRKRKENTGE